MRLARAGRQSACDLGLGGMPIATMWARLATGGLPDELTYPLLIRIRSSLRRLVNLGVEKPIPRSGLPITASLTASRRAVA